MTCDKCKHDVSVLYATEDNRTALYHCEKCTPYLRKSEVNARAKEARRYSNKLINKEEQYIPRDFVKTYTQGQKKQKVV